MYKDASYGVTVTNNNAIRRRCLAFPPSPCFAIALSAFCRPDRGRKKQEHKGGFKSNRVHPPGTYQRGKPVIIGMHRQASLRK